LEALQPLLCELALASDGRDIERRLGVGEELLERAPPLLLCRAAKIAAVRGKRVEGDEGCRRFARELLDARSRWMQSQLQCIEIETVRRSDDDLAVDDAVFGKLRAQRFVQIGKVTVEWTQVAALDVD